MKRSMPSFHTSKEQKRGSVIAVYSEEESIIVSEVNRSNGGRWPVQGLEGSW